MSGRGLRRRFYPVGSSDCKLYLPFYAYGGNQQKIWDISGNNNHATITGAVPSSIPVISPIEKVTNGGFDADTDWTKGSGNWTIGAGVATKVAGDAVDLEQNINVTANKKYLLVYTMTRTAGTLTPQIGGVDGTARVLSGTYTEYVDSSTTGNLKFQAGATFAGTVDNVSVKEVTHYQGGLGWYCDGADDRFTLSNVFTTDQTGLTILSWVYCHSFDMAIANKSNVIYSDWNTFSAGSQKGFALSVFHGAADQNK